MRTRTPTAAGAALLLASWMGGCSNLPSGPETGGIANPRFVRVSNAQGVFDLSASGSASQSQTIDGSKGGSFNCDRFKLIVPAGAWDGEATLSIHVPDVNVLHCHLEISPSSANSFSQHVTLEVDYRETDVVDPASLAQLWYDEADGVWREVPGTEVDTDRMVVRTPLSHFSEYGITETKAGW
jgi:hypothetical protein